jgi:hypothetical protein
MLCGCCRSRDSRSQLWDTDLHLGSFLISTLVRKWGMARRRLRWDTVTTEASVDLQGSLELGWPCRGYTEFEQESWTLYQVLDLGCPQAGDSTRGFFFHLEKFLESWSVWEPAGRTLQEGERRDWLYHGWGWVLGLGEIWVPAYPVRLCVKLIKNINAGAGGSHL